LTHQNYKNTIRWGIIIATIFIVSLILWNTYIFFQQYKDEERIKVEIIAASLQRLNDPDLDADFSLETQVINSNHSIPMILINAKTGIIESTINFGLDKENDSIYLQKQLALMKAQNQPLVVQNPKSTKKLFIYYSDSEILTSLKYYPLGLLLILVFFSIVIFLFSTSNRIASQNKLWTGMAKETAHQIGTPLTSLLGWVAILREDETTVDIADEIEKDVQRLEVIANRFSKIGSDTPLELQNIVELIRKSFAYLKSRSSNQIVFKFKVSEDQIMVNTNSELFGWVIENLIKNAIDAMHGKGKIVLRVQDDLNYVIIKVSDTGKGIPKNMYKRIFEPGFTTKKRGWGLGLSLSKRIIEDFHQGKIYVEKSEVKKGTTFCIKLPKSTK
jgi:LytS/YehU family sensor histidine kinase